MQVQCELFQTGVCSEQWKLSVQEDGIEAGQGGMYPFGSNSALVKRKWGLFLQNSTFGVIHSFMQDQIFASNNFG